VDWDLDAGRRRGGYWVGVGVVGGGGRKNDSGVFLKMTLPLLRVEIKFSSRAYAEII
jgi:hypothetical protein